ncbi:hypothetical protein G6011_04470 [Alternaria panax]|uniref:Uncharacterized protein n=1 Tax=Alternaria panax TaxID=48097 RepID=A0AAD4IH83_9PLEO|nr:hypothetical protein G6011_04470 [Alternaria panax]
MVDEAGSDICYENYDAVVAMSEPPAMPPSERVIVVEESQFTVLATDDAIPSPPVLPDVDATTFAPETAALPSLGSLHPTAPATRSSRNFTVTVPVTVRLPVEAFYRNFPTDASGRRRRVITTNLTYDVAVELPESRTPSVTEKPESPTFSGADQNEVGSPKIYRSTSLQNAPQLVKRPSEEEVIGHNWIKFQDEEQLHVLPGDNPAQMTSMQKRHARKYSQWATLRSKLRNTGKYIGEKLAGSEVYGGDKSKNEQAGKEATTPSEQDI